MEILAGQCGSAHTPDDSPYTSNDSPKSSKVGAFLLHPPPFREKISVSGHQKSQKGTNPIRPNDAIPSFFPSEGAFLSIQPYNLTLYQPKHAKRITQASYQNLGGYMASYADFDTRDGCTRYANPVASTLPGFCSAMPQSLPIHGMLTARLHCPRSRRFER